MPILRCVLILALLFAGACSSLPPSSSRDAQKAIEDKYSRLIGYGTKSQFVEDFGEADWCRPNEDTGGESCRFYKKLENKWVGDDKQNKKAYVCYDEVFTEFGKDGILKSFRATSQR